MITATFIIASFSITYIYNDFFLWVRDSATILIPQQGESAVRDHAAACQKNHAPPTKAT